MSSVYPVTEFNLKRDVKFGKVKTGKYHIVDLSGQNDKRVRLQLSSGGNLPSFAVNRDTQFCSSLVFEVPDKEEFQALEKVHKDLASLAVKNRQSWFPDCNLTDKQIRAKVGKLVTEGKMKKNDPTQRYNGTCKVPFEDKDLKPALLQNGETAKFPQLKILDENQEPISIDAVARRPWTNVIFTLRCVYIQKTNEFALMRRLNYLSVGPLPEKKELDTIEMATFDPITQCLFDSEPRAAKPTDRHLIVGLKNKDHNKLALQLSGGGSLPPFAVDENKMGNITITFDLQDEVEKQKMAQLSQYILETAYERRQTWFKDLPADTAREHFAEEMYIPLMNASKAYKNDPCQFWPPNMKCNFDQNTEIIDEQGQSIDVQEIARRKWTSITLQLSCVYLQGVRKFGVSKKLAKIVVGPDANDDEDIEPVPKKMKV